MTRTTASPSASRPDAAPDEPRRPGRPRDARADRAILEAALVELAEHGYGGLSMDRVAARAGVSKATIYRRWPSREEMIIDAWRALGSPDDRHIDTGTLRGDLLHLTEEYRVDLCAEPMMALLPQIVAAVHQSPKLAVLFRVFAHEQMEPLVELFARAQRRGELRAGVVPQVAAQLLAGLIFTRVLVHGELLPVDELRAGVDMVLGGILAEPDR